MDAWSILTGNSTLASGDAWEHLNNQSGEGGPSVKTYVAESFVKFYIKDSITFDSSTIENTFNVTEPIEFQITIPEKEFEV